jgi:hypothetical protein
MVVTNVLMSIPFAPLGTTNAVERPAPIRFDVTVTLALTM